jgi:hypothetical protein
MGESLLPKVEGKMTTSCPPSWSSSSPLLEPTETYCVKARGGGALCARSLEAYRKRGLSGAVWSSTEKRLGYRIAAEGALEAGRLLLKEGNCEDAEDAGSPMKSLTDATRLSRSSITSCEPLIRLSSERACQWRALSMTFSLLRACDC